MGYLFYNYVTDNISLSSYSSILNNNIYDEYASLYSLNNNILSKLFVRMCKIYEKIEY